MKPKLPKAPLIVNNKVIYDDLSQLDYESMPYYNSHELEIGDIVCAPDGPGGYYIMQICEIGRNHCYTGDYYSIFSLYLKKQTTRPSMGNPVKILWRRRGLCPL